MKIKDSTWLTGILMVGLTVAMLPMAQATTTYLSPSGGDDTPAIQAALNNCIGAPPLAWCKSLRAGTRKLLILRTSEVCGTHRCGGSRKTAHGPGSGTLNGNGE